MEHFTEALTVTRELPNSNMEKLANGIALVDRFINKKYLANLLDYNVVPMDESEKETNRIRFYLVEKIVFDDTENNNDKLISVYSAIQNVGASVLLLIQGSVEGVKYYIGIDDPQNAPISEKTLFKSFKANFPGSSLEKKKNSEIESVLNSSVFGKNDCNISSVTIVPSTRDEDKDKFVQGIEKFIDVMRGENFSALFVSRPVGKLELEERKRGLEQLYTSLSPYVKSTLAYGENESLAVSEGVFENFSHTVNDSVATTFGTNNSTNVSNTKGTNIGMNAGFSFGSNKSTTTGTSSGTSYSKSETTGTADTTGSGSNKTDTTTTGSSKTLTVESTNKTVDVILKNIDEQLERIKSCEAFGIWESAAYFTSDEIQVSIVAANAFKALMSGDSSNVENAYVNTWSQHNLNTSEIAEYIKYCKHPVFKITGEAGYNTNFVTPASYVSGKEIPVFMGLPQKSVNGVSVTTMAEFSRNVFVENSINTTNDNTMLLGNIHHMGMKEDAIVNLNVDSLTSHCFVTGSTGSGKSNTIYHMLQSLHKKGIPFLVVEPAKGEYRKDLGGIEGINVFSTNPYIAPLLKINPFEFNQNIHILEHLDRLIEIFNACWEMYAAMPAILKNAIEKAYITKGWDLVNSVYINGENPQFPTFEDVLNILPKIIKTAGYSSDTQGDYTGALVTRVESLTNGIAGQIFCNNCFIEDKVLYDETTIVDLSRVGSNETKSLIMGILVMKLNEYRMANATGTNKKLSHVTVLEEAHNLLKNVSQAQGQQSANPIGKSVEMICNGIAEMRTYGEGFIIVDQSPTSVDIAAIKNTNTKIVMRLPEQQDCEAMGNSLGLTEEQTKELAKLPVGVAAVMQNNWLDAVLCLISKSSNKFEFEAPTVTYSELNSLKGEFVSEMISQNENKKFDFAAFENIISTSSLPAGFKRDYLSRYKKFCDLMNKQINAEYLALELLNLTGAKNIFDINERHIAENTDEETLNKWKQQMIVDLKKCITLSETWMYESLFSYLLFAMVDKGKNIDYSEIFDKMI